MKIGKIENVYDLGPMMKSAVHGTHDKSLVVLHETVSSDIAGWSDVLGVAHYLDEKDYGMHGIIDKEGHIAWAYGLGKAIFYHAASGDGKVNSRGIGIELVSRVMLTASDNTARWRIWWERDAQINAVAKLLAWLSRKHDIPLADSDSSKPGITTHWEVTKRWLGQPPAAGHWDCWPRHKGGYFPKLRIIERAKFYKARGY
jgi:hypothetical protein